GCVEQKPDMMLFELRRELNSICGIDAGENTISRCLKRRGYTRKKVCGRFPLSYLIVP
ncbi:hypothetical protein EXIGLDRAFT_634497, partial [Exidia glandulosa HHB12029]